MSKTLAAATALAAALAAAMILPGTPGAEEPETWRYQCLGDEVVGSKICTTELATFEDGEEYVVYFVHTDRGGPPLVISGENEGISGVTVAVDKNEALSSTDCDGGSCVFAPDTSAALMKQFRKGFRANVTIVAEGGEVVFQRLLSLRGFTAALTAPPG